MTIAAADIADRHQLRRRSGRWAGPCPKCGGGRASDKFVLREDGGFKCYSCDFKGDFITWLREMEGMSCPEAHEAADQNCRADGCPVRGTCRLGDGSAKRQRRGPRTLAPTPPAAVKTLPTAETRTPAQIWTDWAGALVDAAIYDLRQKTEALAFLAARGIDAATAERHSLGWIERSSKIPRASVGLPPRDDGKDTLWIPAGLVIPTYDASGDIHRLRIRRTDAERERFLSELKYVWIEGSGNAPMVLAPESSRGFLIVEAELDAIACASAHPEVTTVALGTVSAGLDAQMSQHLEAAPVILVALDADPGKDGKTGAGPKAIAAWCRQYRHAKYWPVPAGKDPGDYVREPGADLRSWIEAGLLPPIAPVKPQSRAHAEGTIPLSDQVGGAGLVDESKGEPAHGGDLAAQGKSVAPATQSGERLGAAPAPDPVRCISGSGREFITVFTRGQFRRETDANSGTPVFGSSEIERIKGIDPEGAEALLMIKGIFDGSEIIYHGPILEEGERGNV